MKARVLTLAALTLLARCTLPVECAYDLDCDETELCRHRFCVDAPQTPEPVQLEQRDGWDAPPGSGIQFVVDSLSIAEAHQGFDLDGRCRGEGDCLDNSFWELGLLLNDQIRQGLLGGESLFLIEVSGLDPPQYPDDPELTIRVYQGRDADEPFFPANNFQIPQGETRCCEFLIHPASLSTLDAQARARLRGRLSSGLLISEGPGGAVPLTWTGEASADSEVHILSLRRGVLTAKLTPGLSSIEDGLLGGVVPINVLARLANPLCELGRVSLLCPTGLPGTEFIHSPLTEAQPDIDLDGDGLETIERATNGRVLRCFDGCLEGGCPRVVPPLRASEPWTCALRPEMADGYSVAFRFHAIRATTVGIGVR